MPLMEWDESLDIGVDEMNHQHQGLLKLMNELFDGAEQGMTRASSIKILEELYNATDAHFKEEEEFMASIEFDGLKSHKLIHVNLMQRLAALAQEFKHSTEERLSPDFFNFLKFWLTAHIKGIDIKYGQLCKNMKTA